MTAPIRTLHRRLAEDNLDAILITSFSNISYIARFASERLQERGDAFLLITKDQQFFFTYSIYADAVSKHLGSFTLIRLSRDVPFAQALQAICNKKRLKKIGYESADIRVAEFNRITQLLDKNIFIDTDSVTPLREIKTAEEIERIQTACNMGDSIFKEIIKKISSKISEKQLTTSLDYLIRQNDAHTSFTTIAAFGSNAAFPHHVAEERTVKKGDAILIDFGVKVQGYCSDMTRTVFYGKTSQQNKKVYQTVLAAQETSIDYIQKNLAKGEPIKPSDVDQIGRDYIESKGFPAFKHASHGIGIEVHEAPYFFPSIDNKLTNDMVFSIEPGIYLPDQTGVRIEDIFTIKHNKLIQLTKAPKEFLEL